MNAQTNVSSSVSSSLDGIADCTLQKGGFVSWLNHIGHALADLLFTRSELKIWQSQNSKGETWWYIYDPMMEQHNCFSSEDELRRWIESQYYHQKPQRQMLDHLDRVSW